MGGRGVLVFAAVARMYISSSLLDLEINISVKQHFFCVGLSPLSVC